MRRARRKLGEWFRYLEVVYEDILADGRVTSVSSIYTVIDKVALFLKWLKKKGLKVEDISEGVVREYMVYLRRKGYKASTIHTHVRSLRRALRAWGVSDLTRLLRYPKVRLVYQLPSPQIIEDIIASIRDLMYKVIIALIYETGMRLSECLSLTVNDVTEAPEGYFRIYVHGGKNGEDRTVFVIKYASLLREYPQHFKPKHHLFPSPSRPGPIHPNNVEKILRRIGRELGIKLTPHTLRHVAATRMIKEGMPERVVMKVLGHRSERMMKIYVNLTATDVEETILAKHGIRKEVTHNQNIKCPKCGAINPPSARYCWRCGLPLNQASATERERAVKEAEELLERIKNLLMQNPKLLKQLFNA